MLTFIRGISILEACVCLFICGAMILIIMSWQLKAFKQAGRAKQEFLQFVRLLNDAEMSRL